MALVWVRTFYKNSKTQAKNKINIDEYIGMKVCYKIREQPWRGSIQNGEISSMEVDINLVITVQSLGISKGENKNKKGKYTKN